jgi:hypothetical protein
MNSCTIIKSITYSAYYNPAYQALGRPQYWPHFSDKANSYATSNDRANVIQKASGIENNIVKVEISTVKTEISVQILDVEGLSSRAKFRGDCDSHSAQQLTL